MDGSRRRRFPAAAVRRRGGAAEDRVRLRPPVLILRDPVFPRRIRLPPPARDPGRGPLAGRQQRARAGAGQRELHLLRQGPGQLAAARGGAARSGRHRGHRAGQDQLPAARRAAAGPDRGDRVHPGCGALLRSVLPARQRPGAAGDAAVRRPGAFSHPARPDQGPEPGGRGAVELHRRLPGRDRGGPDRARAVPEPRRPGRDRDLRLLRRGRHRGGVATRPAGAGGDLPARRGVRRPGRRADDPAGREPARRDPGRADRGGGRRRPSRSLPGPGRSPGPRGRRGDHGRLPGAADCRGYGPRRGDRLRGSRPDRRREAPVTSEAGLWNVANVLTIVRIVLVPVFIGFLLAGGTAWRLAALGTFCVASLTDLLDGRLARSRGLVTDFGKIADPVADKALTGAALICLSALGELPWWVTGVIMFRELGVTALRFWVIRRGVIAASRGGKARTLLQIIAICLYLLPASLSPPALVRELFMAAAVVVTVVTGVDYVLQAMRLRRSEPERSEPATGR